MLIRLMRSRLWIASVAILLTSTAVNAQDAIHPAPPEGGAVPEAPASPVQATPAEADGVARVPTAGPTCGPGGCGPGSSVPVRCGPAGCGPRGKTAGCGPAGCGPNGNYGPTGVCGPAGCYSQTGIPCLGPDGCSFTNEQLAGRPLTWGDIGNKLGLWKHKCNECIGYGNGGGGGPVDAWWCQQCYNHQCQNAYRNRVWAAHFNNKLNYFVPSGSGGEGTAPFGKYARVYAAQPDYFDPRDGQVYAAPATGVPTAVLLAPNVHYQYNYGWGVPSSRITPISNYVRPIH